MKAINMQELKIWEDSLKNKKVSYFARGNSRIRKELLVYAVDENDMLLGYFVDSIKIGVVFDKPMERDSITFFKVKALKLKELYQ